MNKDQSIYITGNIEDTNLGVVSLEYKYNNDNDFIQFNSINIVDIDESKFFSNYIPIKQSLSKGYHIITIRAIDSYNKFDLKVFSFKIILSKPEIVEFSVMRESNIYVNKVNTQIPINLSFVDYNGNVNLDIKYQFDNSEIITIQTIKIRNTSIINYKNDIPLPSLAEKDHTLFIFLEDSSGMTSLFRNYQFDFKYNQTEIQINQEYDQDDHPIYMKGINSSFTLNLKAIDINLVEYLDINYEIANTNYQRLLKLSMNYKSTKEFQIQIDIPVEYEENVYKLKISAKNEFNKVSDVITFYFNFSYNRPLLNVTNQIKYR